MGALSPLIAATLIFFSSRRFKGKERNVWLLMLWATISLFIAHVIWSYYMIYIGINLPFPNLADLFLFIFILLYAIAIFYKLYINKFYYKFIQIIMDTFMVLTIITTVGWIYFIKPILNEKGLNLVNLIFFSYPILQMTLFYCLVMFLFIPRYAFHKWTIILNMASTFIYFTTTIIFFTNYINDPTQLSQPMVIYLLWVICPLLIGISSLFDQQVSDYPTTQFKEKIDIIMDLKNSTYLLRLYMPYINIVILTLLTIIKWDEILSIVVGGGIYIILLIIKHSIMLVENKMLINKLSEANNLLEERVRERTQEIELINKELEYMAQHDPMTGLPNRRLFRQRLEACFESSKNGDVSKFALLFIDIDRFKKVNDFLGHETGDYLLIEITKRLKACTRPIDTICRQGGDEFLILLDQINDYEDALAIANKITESLKEPFYIKGFEINITASIGVAIHPIHGSSGEMLMRNADIAMYKAKEKGRNIVELYNEEQSEELSKKVILEKAIFKRTE
ncbi:GGDEF domain-containing protein [Alkaliphilus transvaalensis]|uniref:GGDEF domain-containing protein n=1 Tax=Alkaliphilus transvaalensis TaxID=114628 RepID=UPI000ADE8EEE|nr:GGDEF domain-containing protein [Alkaliphilus transvaalensis]